MVGCDAVERRLGSREPPKDELGLGCGFGKLPIAIGFGCLGLLFFFM